MYTTPAYSPVATRYRRAPVPRHFTRSTMGDLFPIPGVTQPFQPNAPFVFYKTPAQKSSPKMNPADNLDEVKVTAQYQTATPYADAAMPEIEVSGTRIPWYAWAILGAVGVSILLGVARK